MLNGVAAEEPLVGQRPGQTQNHTKSRGFHSPQGGMTKQTLKVKHANNIQKVSKSHPCPKLPSNTYQSLGYAQRGVPLS